MDTFALSISYGIMNLKLKYIIITAITVGLFHFFMPLIGNFFGNMIFSYIIINPKYILSLVFLILSISMIINFKNGKFEYKKIGILSTILFGVSVSIDSFSVGLGITYLYENILFITFIFSIVSALFTIFGFLIGKIVSKNLGKYSFLLGSILLFVYSLYVFIR